MSTIGVLGASGLVGSRLTEMFHLELGEEVIPIVRSTNSLARLARFSLPWRVADALDYQGLVEAFRGCDVVVHAIHGTDELITEAPPIAYRAAQAARVRRLIYLSTIAVHGQNPDPGTDETSPLHARHRFSYNNAKVRAEWEFLRQRGGGDVELVILRPGVIFGPRDRWVSNIARTVVDRTAYVLPGPGICNTVYVDNLVHAIRLACVAPVDGEIFSIVDRETITWRELHNRVSAALGSEWEVPEIADPDLTHEHVDILAKLKRLRPVRAIAPSIGPRWKLGVRKALDSLRALRTAMGEARGLHASTDPWRIVPPARPTVPAEMALLYQCRHKFSYARAQERLQYEPSVSVTEGLRRTMGWLRFVGYPVDDARL